MRNIRTPFDFYAALLVIYLVFSFAIRATYAAWILKLTGNLPPMLYLSVLKGVYFDLCAAVFLFAVTFFICLLTSKKIPSPLLRHLLVISLVPPCLLIIFSTFGELLFFHEFQARYNFIAVDYLVYTHEVIRNIWESYPTFWILVCITVVTAAIIYLLRRMARTVEQVSWFAQSRIVLFLGGAVLFVGFFVGSEEALLNSSPYWSREIGKNTLYALFAAYNRNSINFNEFYPSIDPKIASHISHEWLEEEGSEKEGDAIESKQLASEKEESIIRNVRDSGKRHRWNVVLVVMESMSANFMAAYGNTKNITPNLDRLAKNGMFFTKLYATGTRTVRGLEAIMLSLPPTPGQSILRRPDSDNMFNLGSVFRSLGYETQFLYGGYAYFDNMKEWFSSNHFEVIDRSDFKEEEIVFSNAWGVSDEDLFHKAIKNADVLYIHGKPFLQVIMTTSNHRPYTFPEGRIDLPSHSGRDGGVKYADYAIGKLISQAEKKAWYKDTLFVFVADHDASVAGGTDVPVRDFLIPMIIYNPKLVPAQRIEKLASQIDLAPTLLDFMNISYQSRFFGQSLLNAKAGRALLGTYQKVAWMKHGRMIILSPGKMVEKLDLDENGEVTARSLRRVSNFEEMDEDTRLTVSIYQTASELFHQGLSKLDRTYSPDINLREN